MADVDPILGDEIGAKTGVEDQTGTGTKDTGGESQATGGAADQGGKPGKDKETPAEYFQRLYEQKQGEADKSTQELKDAKPAVEFYNQLAQRPDLIDKLEADLKKSAGSSSTEGKPEYFDAEAAFSDPKSESYRWREAQDNARITAKVEQLLGGVVDNINEQTKLNETQKRLKDEFGLNDEQIPKVMEFLTTPKDQLPLKDVLKVWMEVNDITPPKASESLEAVRRNQEGLPAAGAMAGGEELPPDEVSDMVKRVKAMASGQNFDI